MHRLLVDPIFAQEANAEGLKNSFRQRYDWESDSQTQSWCWIYALESRNRRGDRFKRIIQWRTASPVKLVRVSLELEANTAAGAIFVEEGHQSRPE